MKKQMKKQNKKNPMDVHNKEYKCPKCGKISVDPKVCGRCGAKK